MAVDGAPERKVMTMPFQLELHRGFYTAGTMLYLFDGEKLSGLEPDLNMSPEVDAWTFDNIRDSLQSIEARFLDTHVLAMAKRVHGFNTIGIGTRRTLELRALEGRVAGDVANEITATIASLLADADRLQAENAKLRELASIVRPLAYRGGGSVSASERCAWQLLDAELMSTHSTHGENASMNREKIDTSGGD